MKDTELVNDPDGPPDAGRTSTPAGEPTGRGGAADPEPTGRPETDDAGRRRYRHRGPRRASGGTSTSQGEPERLAGFGPVPGPAGSSDAAGKTSPGASRDEMGRWLLEQRPPHWE
ncbi:hypothetical protein [Kocuria massiliensis]|uniref:hypothetical protein n=1 Tax=Kocuria massiliensis TaxID=1926282 RepID=UPI0022B9BE96|nr:hypothetical protein [Kocuria massiliensis]